MKKLIVFSLCSLAMISAGAQKANVDQAKKLVGKVDKIEEARALIQQAIQDPETSGQVDTWFIAGKIEWDAFDKQQLDKAINPASVDPIQMGEELLNGFNYFVEVFPLDQIPNEKGQVKPKHTKDLQKKIATKTNDFFEAGANFFNGKRFYPEAYNAFMIFGDMPDLEVLGPQKPEIADTMRAIAYFNAGLAAWSAEKVDEAATAFKKARLSNYAQPEACIYEIACWQNIELTDSTREAEAREHIFDAAKAGFEKFGEDQPVFLNNMVNVLVNSGRENDALAVANEAIARYPDRANLYGLLGYINDRMGNDEASEQAYRKAALLPNVDYETLSNVVKKLFRVGQEKWNEIELGDPDTRAKKDNIRENYFKLAKQYAEQARTLTEDPSDIDYLIESIDYSLSL